MLGTSKCELVVCVFMGFGVIWGPQSHNNTSYNIINGSPATCRDACPCLILFADTCGNSDSGTFLMNAVNVQSAIWLTLYYTFTLHTKPTVYTPLQGLMSLKCKPHPLNHAILCLMAEFIHRNSVSLYQHTQHFS
jgi:hypothetical protein